MDPRRAGSTEVRDPEVIQAIQFTEGEAVVIQLAAPSSPVRVVLDVTRRCNLSCWYCHSTSGPAYKGPEIHGRDIDGVFEAADNYGVFDITITGGEPLLWRGLSTALLASRNLHYSSLQIITNATTVDDRRLSMLEDSACRRVCVSIDGPRDVHEANRGEDSFARALSGLRRLRGVIPDITVISVLDASNFDRWLDLTHLLINEGVNQHHLTPVCFAGNAMDSYSGLSIEQFKEVREKVNEVSLELPPEFTLRFNDTLVERTSELAMSMNTFTERNKGWHIVVRPDSSIRASVKAWGRSWRDDEIIGRLEEESLGHILSTYAPRIEPLLERKFPQEEEVKRKFHLGNPTEAEIIRDIEQVTATERDSTNRPTAGRRENSIRSLESEQLQTAPSLPASVLSALADDPARYAFRVEQSSGLVFDRKTFEVTVTQGKDIDRVRQILHQRR